MADRTSAALFGEIFTILASKEKIDPKKLAARFFEMSKEYDFSNYQMGCDEALITLGLAKKGVREEYPEDGEVLLYKGEDY